MKSAAPRDSRWRATRQPDGSLRTTWTLADGVGLVVLISLTLVAPSIIDGTSFSAAVLSVGGVACLPFALRRIRSGAPPTRGFLIPIASGVALLIWGLVSLAGSGSPWPVAAYGWLGRSDGLLTLVGCLALLIAAASLAGSEIDRVVTWLLAAGAVLVLEAIAQLAGSTYPPRAEYEGVSAALGNPNFFAAASAMLAVLALGRALDAARERWQRWAALVLAASLVASSILTQSAQGPVAFAIGLAAGAVAWALQHRGPGRAAALVGAALIFTVTAVGFVLIVLRFGPFAAVREAQTIGYREAYWEAAWRMMSGLPLFGSGPDGYARYVSEFRSETYLEAPGSGIRVSAAHDVALQYGATFGVVGLVLWLILMASVGVLLVRSLIKSSGPTWLVVSLAGAWVAYLAQSAISIDAPALKGLGWLVTGLLVALSIDRPPSQGKRVPWLPFAAAGLGVAALVVWLPSITAVNSALNESTVEGALDRVTSSMTPCAARNEMLVGLSQVAPLDELAAVAQAALDADPRCPGLAVVVSEIQVLGGDPEGALRSAEVAISTDPLAPGSWYVLSRALDAAGDSAGAQSALEEARRLTTIDLDESVDPFLTDIPTVPTANP